MFKLASQITVLFFLTLFWVAEAFAEETGEDETRPVSRFDIRFKYQDLASNDEHRDTLRSDKSLKLNDEWAVGTRLDLPLRYSDKINVSDNPNGDWETGIGDILLQGFVQRQRLERFRCGAGERAVLPTATEDHFGAGK